MRNSSFSKDNYVFFVVSNFRYLKKQSEETSENITLKYCGRKVSTVYSTKGFEFIVDGKSVCALQNQQAVMLLALAKSGINYTCSIYDVIGSATTRIAFIIEVTCEKFKIEKLHKEQVAEV